MTNEFIHLIDAVCELDEAKVRWLCNSAIPIEVDHRAFGIFSSP
jgi:hypothetical protein